MKILTRDQKYQPKADPPWRKKSMKKNAEIIYEDKYLKILNKKPGIISENISSLICHRLDKDTSGLIILAKNQKIKDLIQKQFQKRKISKIYLGLLDGKLKPEKDIIFASIGRKSKKPQMTAQKGRPAVTKYQVLKYLTDGKNIFTLAEIQPKTGRTHQIRVHFKYLGFPVLGDQIYAKGKTKKKAQKLGLTRQFLHAHEIKFKHPIFKKIIKAKSSLPKELNKIINKLEVYNGKR